jgi:hypothetical protein
VRPIAAAADAPVTATSSLGSVACGLRNPSSIVIPYLSPFNFFAKWIVGFFQIETIMMKCFYPFLALMRKNVNV